MANTITARKFSAGENVACYSHEVITFGEIIGIDGDTATVSIELNVYPKNGERFTRLVLEEYVRRGSDGLFVSAECVGQRVPDVMIAHPDDIGYMNQWRYWPSPIEKLKRKFSK